jgi:hypothetical protein
MVLLVVLVLLTAVLLLGLTPVMQNARNFGAGAHCTEVRVSTPVVR